MTQPTVCLSNFVNITRRDTHTVGYFYAIAELCRILSNDFP